MDNKIKQLRKGILELAVLGALVDRKHYGYSLIKAISRGQDIPINEGTIYPILSRLAKEDLVRTEWVESHQGPPRKYYFISEQGKKAHHLLSREFDKLIELVKNARQGEELDKEASSFDSSKRIEVKKEKEDEQ